MKNENLEKNKKNEREKKSFWRTGKTNKKVEYDSTLLFVTYL